MSEKPGDKAALRRLMLAHRQAIPAEVRQRHDIAIGARVLDWWHANPASMLGVYWPICGEPDLQVTYAELIAQGARLALPLAERDQPLRFALWQPGDALIKDAYGVPVPASQALVQPDALLIPCVGFNAARMRLGYGGGFYDRTLALAARPLAIGIAYAASRCEFDGDAHDVVLDAILTEEATWTAAMRAGHPRN